MTRRLAGGGPPASDPRGDLARLSGVTKTKPRSWQLQDAKNQLSAVVDEAVRSGPQVITRRGVDAVVVVSIAEWMRLAQRRKPLVELLRRAPRVAGGLDVTRSSIRGEG